MTIKPLQNEISTWTQIVTDQRLKTKGVEQFDNKSSNNTSDFFVHNFILCYRPKFPLIKFDFEISSKVNECKQQELENSIANVR